MDTFPLEALSHIIEERDEYGGACVHAILGTALSPTIHDSAKTTECRLESWLELHLQHNLTFEVEAQILLLPLRDQNERE